VFFKVLALDEAGYRALALALHLSAALVLLVLARGLLSATTPTRWRDVLALLAAALFTFNRHQHEAVFWYSSMSEGLTTLLRLTSLLLVWWVLKSTGRAWMIMVIAWLLFTLALFSKESAVVFPLEVVLVIALRARGSCGQRSARSLAGLGYSLPFFAGVAAYAFFYSSRASTHVGNIIQRSDLTLLQGPVTEIATRFTHALARCYVHTSLRVTWFAAPAMIALVLLLVLAILHRNRLFLFGLCWTLVTLAPYVFTTSVSDVANHVPIALRETGIGEDRYYNYPSAAAGLLAAASLSWLLQGVRDSRSQRLLTVATVGCVAVTGVYVLANATLVARAERDWHRAGVIAATIVEETVRSVPSPHPGDRLCFVGLPDNYRGKFVFRNGIQQALYLRYGRADFGAVALPTAGNVDACSTVVDVSGVR
jgi:hypothetical protein